MSKDKILLKTKKFNNPLIDTLKEHFSVELKFMRALYLSHFPLNS